MLVSTAMRPQQTIYYLGAALLKCILSEDARTIDSLLLFEDFRNVQKNKVSFTQYMYALNWLYILGAIELDGKGDIIKCF